MTDERGGRRSERSGRGRDLTGPASTVTGTVAAAGPRPQQKRGGGRGRFGAVFAVVAAGIAMVNLDLFIVNVALPSIGRASAARTWRRCPGC